MTQRCCPHCHHPMSFHKHEAGQLICWALGCQNPDCAFDPEEYGYTPPTPEEEAQRLRDEERLAELAARVRARG